MILLVELTAHSQNRYMLLDTIADRYTNGSISIKRLLTFNVGKYRKEALYSELSLPPTWKEVKYDVSDINLTNVTEALSTIYTKYPELLL